jgi:hypothetical protein
VWVINEAFGNNAQRSIDVTSLAPGMYNVVLSDGTDFGTKNFVKP